RDVGDGDADFGRGVGRTSGRDQTALALEQQVERLALAVRAGRAIAGKLADDQARVTLAEGGGGQPEAVGHTRTEVLDKHVGAVQQACEQVTAARALDVEREAALATIEPDKVAGQAVDDGIVAPAEVAAVRPLDLDD